MRLCREKLEEFWPYWWECESLC